MKILIMIVSYDIDRDNLQNIYDKIINPLKEDDIEIHLATCISGDRNAILDKVDYNFKHDGSQLSKVCYLVNHLEKDYDYYIKIRPDIILFTTIDKKFLMNLSKNQINSRCRSYEGPSINLKHGFSCQKEKLRSDDLLYNEEIINIKPDDQLYIFHKNIIDAFDIITENTYLDYTQKIKGNKKYWVDDFMMNENYWNKNKIERENHHKFIWYSRGFTINPIGLDLKYWLLTSSDLILEKPIVS